MAITITANYGDGARPLTSVVDSLIITEADCINRGYAELNKAWKIINAYSVSMPYPNSGYLIEVGKYVNMTVPEVGLVNQTLYIAGVTQNGTNRGTTLSLKLESYEAFETESAGQAASTIDVIDAGTQADEFTNLLEGGTPAVGYPDGVDSGGA